MKKIAFLVFVLFQLKGHSQVQLGQPSSETLYLLTYLIKDHPNWEMEKVYDQGELQQVVVSQYDQVFPDLLVKVDAIQRFVMQDGAYVLNILQFPSLKLDELKNRFDNHYSASRIGDYYFDDGFNYQRTITSLDGTASVLYQATDLDALPETVRQQIQQSLEDDNVMDVEEDYINPFEKYIRNGFEACTSTKIFHVYLNQFENDSESDYPTSSHRTIFCDGNRKIVLDYLIEEGVDGFYYFTCSSIPYDKVVQMVLDSYHLSFDLDNSQPQKKINEMDPKAYTTMEHSQDRNGKVTTIKNYYDGNPEGDYIRIRKNPNNTVQVHISYNGSM